MGVAVLRPDPVRRSERLRSPSPVFAVVDRPRLLDRLDRAIGRPVTVVRGGPGSGKTTLVGSWVTAGRVPGPVAWLSLDAHDRVPERFWGAVLDAVRSTGAVPPDGLLAALLPDRVDGVFTDLLVEAFATMPVPVVLVLDDVHLLDLGDAGPLPVLERLARSCRDRLRLVLLTRVALPLQRLVVESLATELTAADLAATRPEARDLLALDGVALGEADLDELVARTEGWVGGLRLAALALQDEPDVSAALARWHDGAGTADSPTGDYLTQELLSRLDGATLAFLVPASLPEQVCPSLAAVLTGISVDDAAARLDALARTNAFVTRLDGPGPWYRLHRLLADLLRGRGARDPVGWRALHRRACLWLESDGQWLAALEHALESDDWPLVAAVSVRSAGARLLGPERPVLLRLFARIPPERAHGDAILTAALAARAYCAYDVVGLSRYVAEAWRLLAGTTGGDPQLRATTALVLRLMEAALAKLQGDARTMRTAASDVQRRLADLPPAAVPAWGVYDESADLLHGLAEIWTGELDRGAHRLAERLARGRGAEATRLHAAGVRAVGLTLAGRPDEATAAARETLDRAWALGWERRAQAGGAWAALALGALERGDLAAAADAVAAAHVTMQGGVVDRFVRIGVEVATVLERLLAAGPDAALVALEEADAVLAAGRSDGVLPTWVAVVAAEVHLAAGDPAAAAARIASARPGAPGALAARLDVLAARARLAAGDTGGADDALADARQGAALLDDLTRVELDLTRAAVADARGERAAPHLLGAAVDRAARRGLVRPFLLAGPDVPHRLAAVGSRSAPARALVDAVRSHVGPDRSSPDRSNAVRSNAVQSSGVLTGARSSTPLTERERDVLAQLPSLLTVEEIAAALHVSANTVRHHQKSIYRKLGVTTRRAAVGAAYGHRLLTGATAP